MIRQLMKRFLKYSLWALAIVVISTHVLFILYTWVPIPGTPLMIHRSIQATFAGRSPFYSYEWEPIEKISKRMQEAVIAAEDSKFFQHYGFDFEAIEKAVHHNKRAKKVRGASTITQQVAKNLFLWPDRSWVRKGLEVYWTLLMETFWSKERILEVYLNIIEVGDGIYGVEAGAQHFFKKPAMKLGRNEACLIAAVLPSPLKMRINNPSSYLRMRQTLIIRRSFRVGDLNSKGS